MPITERQLISTVEEPVSIEVDGAVLKGDLVAPEDAFGLVLFPAGGGVNRYGARSRRLLEALEEQGLATLAFDPLTASEAAAESSSARQAADLPLIATRIAAVNAWACAQPEVRRLPFGYFASGLMAAAILAASTEKNGAVAAIVSRNGATDLVADSLPNVRPPILLLVGANDQAMLRANETALFRLAARSKELIIIPAASSRFDDSSELATAAELAADWFARYLILLS